MNCKYIRIRSNKGLKYVFCIYKKKKIQYDECYLCDFKCFKEYKKIKKKKHSMTKATEIQKGVKEIVWKRDGYKCIFCHEYVHIFYANAHFIPRSQGGLGIEENIFTACEKCHNKQENGLNTKEMEQEAEEYLKSKYIDWSKNNLIYKKY